MKVFDPGEGYDLYASRYREDHAHLDSFDWEIAGLWTREALSSARLAAQKQDRVPGVLELGCGDGRVLSRLVRWSQRAFPEVGDAGFRFAGADLSARMLKLAAKKVPQAYFFRSDVSEAREMESALGQWGRADVILGFFVLVHLARPEALFTAAARNGVPLARLVVNNVPQREPPVLEAEGHRFRIVAFHHEDERIARAASEAGWRESRRQVVSERGEPVSTVFEFVLQESSNDG